MSERNRERRRKNRTLREMAERDRREEDREMMREAQERINLRLAKNCQSCTPFVLCGIHYAMAQVEKTEAPIIEQEWGDTP